MVSVIAGPMKKGKKRGGESAGTSDRGPETQEGARESLKIFKALTIDVLF